MNKHMPRRPKGAKSDLANPATQMHGQYTLRFLLAIIFRIIRGLSISKACQACTSCVFANPVSIWAPSVHTSPRAPHAHHPSCPKALGVFWGGGVLGYSRSLLIMDKITNLENVTFWSFYAVLRPQGELGGIWHLETTCSSRRGGSRTC